MNVGGLLSLSLAALLTENIALVRLLGAGTLLRQSGGPTGALRTGGTMTAAMVVSVLMTWVVDRFLLLPLELTYLRLVAFLMVIAAVVRLFELLLRRGPERLRAALGPGLPLAAVNCGVLGVALLSAGAGYGFLQALVYALFSGLGFTLVAVVFAGLQEQLTFAKCPKAFQGLPIALVTAGLLAMTFLGFSSLRL